MQQSAFPFHEPADWLPTSIPGVNLGTIRRILRGLGAQLSEVETFVALLLIAGPQGCFPSHASIAERSGLSESTVKRSLGRLRERGLVSWTRRSSCRGNRYRFHRPEAFHAVAKCRPRGEPRAGDSPPAEASPGRRKIGQDDQRKSVKMTHEQGREDQEARPSGRAGEASENREPERPDPTLAAAITREIESASGLVVQEADPFIATLAQAGEPRDVLAWIASKRRMGIRSVGFFVHVAQRELDDWCIRKQQERRYRNMEREYPTANQDPVERAAEDRPVNQRRANVDAYLKRKYPSWPANRRAVFAQGLMQAAREGDEEAVKICAGSGER